jgi:hypothetical protein
MRPFSPDLRQVGDKRESDKRFKLSEYVLKNQRASGEGRLGHTHRMPNVDDGMCLVFARGHRRADLTSQAHSWISTGMASARHALMCRNTLRMDPDIFISSVDM